MLGKARTSMPGRRMNKNVARGQATRAHLIDVATRLFTERGYDGTSIEAVLAESGVSRGSLYHHFPCKEALFWAVLEGVATRVGEELAAATRGIQDPVAALRAECLAWIRLAGDPVVQQTALIDAPAVLGWQRWRELRCPKFRRVAAALRRRRPSRRKPPRRPKTSARRSSSWTTAPPSASS